jgi:Flp pilus assembly protein TadB
VTTQQLKSLIAPKEVLVAGVPWPRYKLLALLAGFAALVLVAVVTTSVAPSVLVAAGVAVGVGLVLWALQQARR